MTVLPFAAGATTASWRRIRPRYIWLI